MQFGASVGTVHLQEAPIAETGRVRSRVAAKRNVFAGTDFGGIDNTIKHYLCLGVN
ncbi:hypothetical protein GCM10022407_12320 [Hymenobacter antarcticus]|uniref:Uncharacterized protein n=1 Tax=Hymenobacter antarcticus TaxID=486270 RepID=A0ABP7PM70_9BACT